MRGITSIDMRNSSAEAVSMWTNFSVGIKLQLILTLHLDWSTLVRSRDELREIVDPYYIFFDFQAAPPG
jgi:hypothetical protein